MYTFLNRRNSIVGMEFELKNNPCVHKYEKK